MKQMSITEVKDNLMIQKKSKNCLTPLALLKFKPAVFLH